MSCNIALLSVHVHHLHLLSVLHSGHVFLFLIHDWHLMHLFCMNQNKIILQYIFTYIVKPLWMKHVALVWIWILYKITVFSGNTLHVKAPQKQCVCITKTLCVEFSELLHQWVVAFLQLSLLLFHVLHVIGEGFDLCLMLETKKQSAKTMFRLLGLRTLSMGCNTGIGAVMA